MNAPPLRISGLSKHYGRGPKSVKALSNLDLQVEPGQVYAFLGPNGAGKTTTMHCVLDYIRPTSGKIEIFGIPAGVPDSRKRLGFLPELFSFDRFLSGTEIVRFHGRLAGVSPSALVSRADFWLERLGLAEAKQRRLSTYSKGMMQRVGLACALVGDPDLVMLDEPTSGMDPGGKRDVMDLFSELRGLGRTVFLSSHILTDVEKVADRVAVIHQGSLRYEGPLSSMLKGEDITLVRFGAPREAQVQAAIPRATTKDGAWEIEAEGEEARRALLKTIQEQGWELLSVVPRRKGLDDAFVDLLKSEEQAG
jgi:ABC-2 type transport system ATP-binding protein